MDQNPTPTNPTECPILSSWDLPDDLKAAVDFVSGDIDDDRQWIVFHGRPYALAAAIPASTIVVDDAWDDYIPLSDTTGLLVAYLGVDFERALCLHHTIA